LLEKKDKYIVIVVGGKIYLLSSLILLNIIILYTNKHSP